MTPSLIKKLLIFVWLIEVVRSQTRTQSTTPATAGGGGGPQERPCISKICTSEAERVKSKMDLTAKPCENFFQFACGKYQPRLTDEKPEVDEFTILDETWKEKLQEIFEERIKASEGTSGKLVKSFYQSCMNTGVCFKFQ